MPIDSLLVVRAFFFDKGSEIDFHSEYDNRYLCSFGELDGNKTDEYIADIPSEEVIDQIDNKNEEEKKRSLGISNFYVRKDYPKAKVVKDFVLFDYQAVSLREDENPECGVDWEVEALGSHDAFEPLMDDLMRHAKEVRENTINKKIAQFKRQYPLMPKEDGPKVGEHVKVEVVNFVLVMTYDCHRCSWEYDEYDCELGILRRIDANDIASIPIKKGNSSKKHHDTI